LVFAEEMPIIQVKDFITPLCSFLAVVA